MRLCACALALLTPLASARTQGSDPDQAKDTTRLAARGRCLTSDGSPWVGARVVAFSRALGRLEYGALDEVAGSSDERGRFRLELLPGRAYSVWAHGEDGRVSRLHEDFLAGGRVRLVATAAARSRACKLHFDDRAEWPRRLKFRLAWLGHNARSSELELEEQRLELPTLPRERIRLECLGEGGELLAWREIDASERDRESLNWSFERGKVHELLVQDSEGKAIAGAELLVRPLFARPGTLHSGLESWNQEQRWWRVAHCDAKGRARFASPSPNVNEVLVTAPGMRSTFHLLALGRSVRLEKQAVRRVRLMRDAKTPLAAVAFLALARETALFKINQDDVARTVDRQARLLRSDAQGYAEIPGGAETRIELVLDSATTRELGPTFAKLRSVHLGSVAAKPKGDAPTVLRLDRLVRRRVVATRRDGMPAAFARVIALDTADGGDALTVVQRCDRKGRTELLLPSSEPHGVLVVAKGQGWGQADLLADAETKVELKPFLRLPIRVRDEDGKPVPHARTRIKGAMWMRHGLFFRQASQFNANALTILSDAQGEGVAELLPWAGLAFSVYVADQPKRIGALPNMNVNLDAPPERLELSVTSKKKRGKR